MFEYLFVIVIVFLYCCVYFKERLGFVIGELGFGGKFMYKEPGYRGRVEIKWQG